MSRVRVRGRVKVRPLKTTVLIVGEGLAENAFLRHLRCVYLGSRNAGLTLTTKNAKGKGGKNVLETAKRHQRLGYDRTALLVDTDTDWSYRERQDAHAQGIRAIESDPCFEATLLKIAGKPVPATTAACKKCFHKHFGGHAHDERIYPRHFGRAELDAARATIVALDEILTLLSC